MSKREQEEEKNKRVGWLVSVGVQLFLLILFYFLIAWKAPFPPIPEYGIELGFTTSAGSKSQPTTPVNSQTEEQQEEEPENVQEDTPVESAEENAQDADETETVEVEESDTPVDTEEVASSQPEIEEEVVEEEANEVDNPVSEAEEHEPSEEEQLVEEPTIDNRAIYGNQGSDTGNEEGASLALAGWIWDFKPNPDDTSDEVGKIVYKIVVDQDGYLVQIETVTSTVSPSVERKYRSAVQKLTFSKTSDYTPAPLSNGTLTFIIKAR